MKNLFCMFILSFGFLSWSLPTSARAMDYIVGEGDVLKITVYDHDDLTTTVRVGGEGIVQIPLVGQIKVDGLSVDQVAAKLSKLFADGFIVNPQVSVFIDEFRSKRTIILGHVLKPGLYELSGPTTFLELISKAGGLTQDAGDTAVIKRKAYSPGGEESVITIDLKKLVEQGDTSLNTSIMDGDSIYVNKAGVFFVTGEVKKPDSYKASQDTTVIKAITMAGGFTDKASATNVKIIRKIDGKEKVIEKAKMDEQILANDVIVVPESFF